MTRHRKKPSNKGRSTGRSVPPYPYEFRLKVAKLYVEDGYPATLVAKRPPPTFIYDQGLKGFQEICERPYRKRLPGQNPAYLL